MLAMAGVYYVGLAILVELIRRLFMRNIDFCWKVMMMIKVRCH
jgi:hypothetical protein